MRIARDERLAAALRCGLTLMLVSGGMLSPASAQDKKPRVGIDTTFGDRYQEAQAAFRADRWADVIRTTTAALALKPDPKNASILLNWRAYAYSSLRQPRKALADLNEAIRHDRQASYAHVNRGLLRMDFGEYELAVSDFSEAIRQRPNEADVYGLRGQAYLRLGQRERARADLERGAAATAKTADDYYYRGRANFLLRRYAQAGSDFARAARLGSKDSAILNQLGWFQATCPDAAQRDGRAAVRNATRACELSQWKDAGVIDTLAAAYAEIGDFAQAMRYATDAASMPILYPRTRAAVQDHLRAFRAGKPWRDETGL